MQLVTDNLNDEFSKDLGTTFSTVMLLNVSLKEDWNN